MKRSFWVMMFSVLGLFALPYGVYAQAPAQATSAKPSSSLTALAQKRTQRLKDELFLSNDQYDQLMQINIEILKRLEKINSSNLSKAEKNKQIADLDNWARNKIVPLLTPAQRERFESTLFAKIYQTRIDKKRAYTQNRR